MLAQLLARRIGALSIPATRKASLSPLPSHSTRFYVPRLRKLPSQQAGRTFQDAHTCMYQSQAAKNSHFRCRSPMGRITGHVVENCLTQWRLSVFTITRTMWGQGAPRKGVLNQEKWQRAGCVWLKLPQRTPVRGIGTFSHFRKETYSSALPRYCLHAATNLLEDLTFLYWYQRSKSGNLSQMPVWCLMIANGVVCAMWETEERHWMIRNFMVSIDSVLSGRFHTLLTYSISNIRLDNLVEVMLGLYFFGGEIAHIYGGSYMLNIYLAGALAGSLGHMAYCAILVPWIEGNRYDDFNYRQTPYALGANGATNALVVLHVLLFPTHIILANFVFPVPAIIFGAYLILADVWQVYEDGTRTTHAGHCAAALMGVVAYARIKRGYRRPLRPPG